MHTHFGYPHVSALAKQKSLSVPFCCKSFMFNYIAYLSCVCAKWLQFCVREEEGKCNRFSQLSNIGNSSRLLSSHCPKSTPNFHDITWNVEESQILHEIFRIVSSFLCYISCYIRENWLTLWEWRQTQPFTVPKDTHA